MRTVLVAFGCGFGFVLFLFTVMMLPGIGRLGELLLGPGYALPEAYWGAVHDPLQLLLTFVLNVLFYAGSFLVVLWVRKRKRLPTKSGDGTA
jgi:hypothetical protein